MKKISNYLKKIEINPIWCGGGAIFLCCWGIAFVFIGLNKLHKVANDILFRSCLHSILFIILISFLLNLLSILMGTLDLMKKKSRINGVIGILSGIVGFIFLVVLGGFFIIVLLAD